MRQFEYEGKDKDGQPVKGQLAGLNSIHVEEQLMGQGVQNIRISEVSPWLQFARPERKGLKADEIVLLSEQLETIARNGMPLAPAITHLAEDVRGRKSRRILQSIQKRLEAGGTLAEALTESGAGLSPAILSLIQVGEQTGNLAAVLVQVSKHYGRVTETRNAIRQAVAYPLVLIVAACLLVSAMYTLVVPQFTEIWGSFGRSLPAPTQFVVSTSKLIQELLAMDMLLFWVGLLIALLLVRLYFGLTLQTRLQYMRFQEWMRYSCPFFGNLYRVANAERFARVLGLLIINQAQVPESLSLAGVASGSLHMTEAAQDAALMVKNGSRLSEALASMHQFRASFLWIVGNAETQGELGQTLLRLADSYEREVERRAAMGIAFAAPAIITAMGILVGGLIITLFLPILQLSSLVS